ncbi:Antolefinin Antolefinine [Fasciola gigantica]|uniref:Antolefinin Antolefinine n=2 Tax=Fasciola TaxID=6191 RepID=A0A4E0S2I4_FASHE|nr:Antolefinin Antolefinine [Fasciola hepatica]TPP66169.1 Antolefinin Antolefinine [Fasciola gigantica]
MSWNEQHWWHEGEDTELTFARDKLDSLLQTLKENPEKTKLSSKYRDDVMGRKELQDKEKFRSPFMNVKCGSGEIKRKKRRVPSEDEDAYKESFVIKVFERSVDFGQFGEMAPLYPMARAWIRNLNQGDASSWNDVPPTDEDQENSDQAPDCHYALPRPNDGLTDNDVRIPAPLPSDGQPFVINVENPSKEMSPEGLLEQHISRWREIRQKWKAACRDNEERYMDSYLILKETYDKFCKDIP